MLIAHTGPLKDSFRLILPFQVTGISLLGQDKDILEILERYLGRISWKEILIGYPGRISYCSDSPLRALMWRRKTRSSPSVLVMMVMIEGPGPGIFPVHCDNSGDLILLLTRDCSALWLLSRRASLEH